MNKQIEITKPTKLLNEKGELLQPGYCKRNIYEYNRENITAPKWRIKEWDFYQVGNDRYMVQICFFNISIASSANATLLDLKTGKVISSAKIKPFTINKYQMPKNGDKPYHFEFKEGKVHLEFSVSETTRTLKFNGISKGEPLEMEFSMDMLKDHESITIATPFEKRNRFFYTQKINCMPAQGYVKHGNEVIKFDKKDTYGVLDWGRGVWPHKNAWYWGNGSTMIDNKLFGFEITWGFGDETNATETALFYDGKCHKIGAVEVEQSPKGRWMKPWKFVSEDNRFNLTMTPFYDHINGVKVLGLVGAKCHQVHGYWNGNVTLDDGKILEIKDMYAFCEYMENLW